jgi:glucose uptake protein GlcU
MLPDMLMANRVMTESVVYPLFLLCVLLIYKRLAGENNTVAGALMAAGALFLLIQAKSGSVALAVVFAGILAVDLILSVRKPAGLIREQSTTAKDLRYILVFIGAGIVLFVLARIINQALFGMDFSLPSIYQT